MVALFLTKPFRHLVHNRNVKTVWINDSKCASACRQTKLLSILSLEVYTCTLNVIPGFLGNAVEHFLVTPSLMPGDYGELDLDNEKKVHVYY